MERERLAKLGSMILTNPSKRIAMRKGITGTIEAMGPSSKNRGAVVEVKVQGHPTRAQSHEGSDKGPSSSLYGRPGTTN